MSDIWEDRRVRIGYESAEELAKHYNPLNFRGHPDSQRNATEESLDTLGYVGSIKKSLNSGVVLDGHLRIEIALAKDPSIQLPVDYYDLTPDEELLALQILDATTEMAQPIADKLAALMERTRAIVADKPGLAAMLESLRVKAGVNGKNGQGPPEEQPITDKAEELQRKWQVKPGDVWQIDRHFIICGDCREADTWSRLLEAAGVDKVNGVFTSPPYWVGKTYETEFTWPIIQEFIAVCAKRMTEFTSKDGRIIVNTGTCQAGRLLGGVTQMRLLLDDWQRELTSLGWPMRYVRFWGKRGGLPLIGPDMDVIDVHTEFLGYFYDPKSKPFTGQRKVGEGWATDGLWDDIPGERSANGTHEAAFPVELVRRNILLHSDPGDIWLDCFCGSGTTIAAAHNEDRRGLGIEKLPKYVSVICERLQTLTQQQPRLVSE